MELIGRKNEIALLDSYMQSGKPEFIALYGRRRVGKTFLLERYFNNKYTFCTSGVINGTREEQMGAFVQSLRRIGYEGKSPETWMDAFFILENLLDKHLKDERCVIFIDELPCFDTPKARFVQAFGHFWNSWAQKHPQIMLIVCGSATTWMVTNLVNSHGGLHNRITHEMHLHPFTLSETEQMLKAKGIVWDRLSVLQIYMILGGIPYYIDMVNRGESVSQSIDRLFFSDNASLKSEYERVFASLFRNPAPYLDIMTALSNNKKGMTRNEIKEAIKSDGNGHLTEYLTNLQNCDFIRYYFTKSKKMLKSNGLYQITDFYTVFYNTFLTTPINDVNYWSHNIETSRTKTWLGLAFERVCMAHILQIKKSLGIDRIGTTYYSWRSKESEKGVQIDLLIERADRVINLCEIKYSNQPYAIDKDEDIKMRTRQADFITETSTQSTIFPTLISTFGLKRNIYSGGIVAEVTLNDLFV